jgi:hypothetical protein
MANLHKALCLYEGWKDLLLLQHMHIMRTIHDNGTNTAAQTATWLVMTWSATLLHKLSCNKPSQNYCYRVQMPIKMMWRIVTSFNYMVLHIYIHANRHDKMVWILIRSGITVTIYLQTNIMQALFVHLHLATFF